MQAEDPADCLICAYPYDRMQRTPRILQCGHTFCQTCLFELRRQRGDGLSTVQCPHCRKHETVFAVENLPENEYVFEREPGAFNMNIFSPYEAAKRLTIESKSLLVTGEKYLRFLGSLERIDLDYDAAIVANYEAQSKKVDAYKVMMTRLVEEHAKQMQAKLLQQMLQQRTAVSHHMKQIDAKEQQI